MFRVIVHAQAEEDIFRNAKWWAENHSVDQAGAWVDAVESQFNELVENPCRFGFAEENGCFAYAIHQMLVGLGNRRSYRAIFTVVEGKKDVHVLGVMRAAQGYLALGDLPSEP